MPRDGTIPPGPPPFPQRLPTRDDILAQLREQNIGRMVEQILSLEADKAVLLQDNDMLRMRLATLEAQSAPPSAD